jgi:hypothetical protein
MSDNPALKNIHIKIPSYHFISDYFNRSYSVNTTKYILIMHDAKKTHEEILHIHSTCLPHGVAAACFFLALTEVNLRLSRC